jgi:hypothetical protein
MRWENPRSESPLICPNLPNAPGLVLMPNSGKDNHLPRCEHTFGNVKSGNILLGKGFSLQTILNKLYLMTINDEKIGLWDSASRSVRVLAFLSVSSDRKITGKVRLFTRTRHSSACGFNCCNYFTH